MNHYKLIERRMSISRDLGCHVAIAEVLDSVWKQVNDQIHEREMNQTLKCHAVNAAVQSMSFIVEARLEH